MTWELESEWAMAETTFFFMQNEFCPSISQFMAYVHKSVNEMSKQYLANERRYNYTTPKSFLELVIEAYKLLNMDIYLHHSPYVTDQSLPKSVAQEAW